MGQDPRQLAAELARGTYDHDPHGREYRDPPDRGTPRSGLRRLGDDG